MERPLQFNLENALESIGYAGSFFRDFDPKKHTAKMPDGVDFFVAFGGRNVPFRNGRIVLDRHPITCEKLDEE